jgi:hypothetical protein
MTAFFPVHKSIYKGRLIFPAGQQTAHAAFTHFATLVGRHMRDHPADQCREKAPAVLSG